VATVPEVVEKLIKLGFAVAVESGAGDAANCSDDSYRAAGATVIDGAAAVCGRPPTSCSRSAYRRRRKSACCAQAAP
jgi:NAD/NADP transhydrogenase alpha subunit